MSENKKNVFSTWLEQLQQESWHLELLISGFALFGLFQATDKLPKIYSTLNANPGYGDADTILNIGMVVVSIGLSIFIVNLTVHLIVRGLWIGAIGLRYFSGDIDYDQIKFSDRFKHHYQNRVGNFDKYIERLENIASVIFSYTFLLFFVFASAMIFIVEIVGIFTIVKWLSGSDLRDFNYSDTPALANWISIGLLFIFLIILVLALVVMLDFILLNPLKRIRQRRFSYVYLGISRFFGWITLSFIWRPLYLNFLDRKETRFLLILIVPYFLLLTWIQETHPFVYSYFPNMEFIEESINNSKAQEAKHSVVKSFYGEYWKENIVSGNINILCLENKRLRGRLGEVFIKYDIEMEEMIYHEKIPPLNEGQGSHPFARGFKAGFEDDHEENTIDSSRTFEVEMGSNKIKNTLGGTQAISQVKDKLMDYFWLSIDDQRLAEDCIDCNFYIHENAGEKGLLCHFRIDSLDIGQHYLTYDKVRVSPRSRDEIVYDTSSITIPFLYEGL